MDAVTIERRRVLVSHAQSVKSARQFVTEVLDEWGHEKLAETAELIVSELTTNVVLHTPCELLVVICRLSVSQLTIGVADTEAATPMIYDAGQDAECGRGLLLVGALADSWGHEPCGDGKFVYAQLAT